MRNVLKVLLVMLFVLFVASSAFAQGNFKDIFFKSSEEVNALKKAEAEAPAIRTLFSDTLPLPINLTGDTIYLARAGTWGAGIGMDFASWKGVLTLRAEASASDVEGGFLGVGVFLNIPKLVSLISDTEWNAAYFNPSIGVVPGFDFGLNQVDVGLVLSIIQVTF